MGGVEEKRIQQKIAADRHRDTDSISLFLEGQKVMGVNSTARKYHGFWEKSSSVLSHTF